MPCLTHIFFVTLQQQLVRHARRLIGKRAKIPYSPAAVNCPWRRKHLSLNMRLGRRLPPGNKSEYLPLLAFTRSPGLDLTPNARP